MENSNKNEQKRGRGRPVGSRDALPRVRKNTKSLIRAARSGQITRTAEKAIEALKKEVEIGVLRAAKYQAEHGYLIETLRNQRDATVKFAQGVNEDIRETRSLVEVRWKAPVEIVEKFHDIINQSPFTKTDILNNLLLNFVKSYNGLSSTEIEKLRQASLEIERRQYQATMVSAKHTIQNPANMFSIRDQSNSISGHKEHYENQSELRRNLQKQVDAPMPVQEIADSVGIETKKEWDYSDLFRD